MKSDILLRPFRKNDCAVVLELIRELAAFQGQPDEVAITLPGLEDAAFGDKPVLEGILAEKDGEVVGAALIFEKYSTWKGRGAHLEDLIVKERYRGLGIGSRLFEAVMKLCLERGYGMMDWQILESNEPAIRFYEKYGSSIAGDWLNGRLSQKNLEVLFNGKSKDH